MERSTVAELKQLPPAGKTPFRGVFILLAKELRTARNGNEFLAIDLGDRSGSFRTNCFQDSTLFPTLETADPGTIVEVQGDSDFYNNNFSPRLNTVQTVDKETASAEGLLDTLVKVSAEDPEALRSELASIVETIGHPELKATVDLVLRDHESTFFSSPAAISMHHAYRFGLLEHTVRMSRAGEALFPLYPEIDADLALAGIILHDVGKVAEYNQGFSPGKTREGILHGHVVLGYQIVRKAAIQSKLDPDLTQRLEHIILSHQGELEWGAATKAATPEAVFVSMVDNLDAKMGMVQEALRQALPDQEFSEFLPGLGTQLLLLPPEKRNP